MNTSQYQALEAYMKWLDQPYTLHLTTRLPYTPTTFKANMHLIHKTLAPLQKYLGIPLAGISTITDSSPRHAHTLLLSPSASIDIRKVQNWINIRYHRINHDPFCIRTFNPDTLSYEKEYLINCTHDLSRTLCVRPHNQNTEIYVYQHLLKQDAALHFFNFQKLRSPVFSQ